MKGTSDATKRREAKKRQNGEETVLEVERIQARRNLRDNAIRSAYNKKRDAKRKNKPSGERRDVSAKRNEIPYPPGLATKMEASILEMFKKYPSTQLRWKNIQDLFELILEKEWDRLPPEVQADGKTKKGGRVKWRKKQFGVIANKYMDEDWGNIWELKEEFYEEISGDNADTASHGKSLKAIMSEVVDIVCEPPVL